VKEWGFGPVAYLFDYIDPILRVEVLKEFDAIYKKFSSLPATSGDYKDPYDLAIDVASLDKTSAERVKKQLEKMKSKVDKPVYDKSINAVQLRAGIKELKWNHDSSSPDFAKGFVKKYDINGDGRLSPRELILGSIYGNSHIMGNDECKLCYDVIVDQLDAMFYYMDCDKSGTLSAENMFRHFQELKRMTSKHNFFLLANIATIRTAVINDFVLKNMSSVKGKVNKKEFRDGILLGFWDRQTSDTQIVTDESRNLKDLRWDEDHLTDTIALKYVKKVLISRAEAIQADRLKAGNLDRR
jgi:hypothetical protein